MSALALAAFLEIAAACAPGVAPETLANLARTESGLDPLAIGINGPSPASLRPATPAEAIERATSLIAQGRSIDLGIMQISHRNLGWLGLSVADAFDPCRSIAAGAAVLTAYSRYNTGSPTRGFANGYVSRVLAAGRGATPTMPPRAARSAPPPPSPPTGGWDVWAVPAPPAALPDPPGAPEAPPVGDDTPRLIVELAQ